MKHETHPDAAHASADAVLSGTDLECGGNFKSITDAVKKRPDFGRENQYISQKTTESPL